MRSTAFYSASRMAAAVARKELLQIIRDRRTLSILLLFPAFVLVIYGYALSFDVKHVRLGVEDRDRSAESRSVIAAFTHSEYFDLVATVTSVEQLESLMDRGLIRAALVIPDSFGRTVRTGLTGEIQIIIDGDNANIAAAVVGYVNGITRALSAGGARGDRAVHSRGTGDDNRSAGSGGLLVEPRVWFNPELRTTWFLIPGLIVYIATITAVISTSLSMVREKEEGTMEQVRMSSIGTLSFVIGKTAPYLVVSLASAMLIVIAAMGLFGLPMRGSWPLLFAATALFQVGALGFGVLVSTLAMSQQVAFQIAMIVSFLPTFILSGFVFPIASMPGPIQMVTYVVPARYYLVVLRGIILKGVGLEEIGAELAALALFVVATLGLAAMRLARDRT